MFGEYDLDAGFVDAQVLRRAFESQTFGGLLERILQGPLEELETEPREQPESLAEFAGTIGVELESIDELSDAEMLRARRLA